MHAARDNLTTPPSSRDPGALSGTLAGVSFVGGVAGAMALADSPYPRPGSEPAEIRCYFKENSGAARLSVVGQLVSAASLARFTASVEGDTVEATGGQVVIVPAGVPHKFVNSGTARANHRLARRLAQWVAVGRN